jgi:hypothetical protein
MMTINSRPRPGYEVYLHLNVDEDVVTETRLAHCVGNFYATLGYEVNTRARGIVHLHKAGEAQRTVSISVYDETAYVSVSKPSW